MDWSTMQGDTRNAIQATLSTPSGTVVDLTGASVQFRMAQNKTIVVNRSATIVDAVNGVVLFVFQANETATSGTFDAQFKVTYPDGSIESFPNTGDFRVLIQSDIA